MAGWHLLRIDSVILIAAAPHSAPQRGPEAVW
jgi:hypothetical protein